MLLQLFTGVVFEVVAFVFSGVDFVLGKTFSGSESSYLDFGGYRFFNSWGY